MRRVMVVGGPGSGKSTLARALGAATGLPVFHMDHIHYLPGWVERDAAEKVVLVGAVHARNAWILEGGHSRTYAERVARADTMIWLDVPLGVRIFRVVRRVAVRRPRPDLPPDCPERLRGTLELVRFMLRTRVSARAKLAAIAADPPPHLRVHRLRSVREVRAFLAEVGGKSGQRVGTGVSPR